MNPLHHSPRMVGGTISTQLDQMAVLAVVLYTLILVDMDSTTIA